jgi:hypothetical protein
MVDVVTAYASIRLRRKTLPSGAANGNVHICVICASLGATGSAVSMIAEMLEHG